MKPNLKRCAVACLVVTVLWAVSGCSGHSASTDPTSTGQASTDQSSTDGTPSSASSTAGTDATSGSSADAGGASGTATNNSLSSGGAGTAAETSATGTEDSSVTATNGSTTQGGTSSSTAATDGVETSGTTATSTGGVNPEACLSFAEPTLVGEIANMALNGPSGLVASRQNPGVLYAHLDAGGPATVFALTQAGTDLGSYTLDGVSQVDWEDIALGAGPDSLNYVFVGDIGDNAARQGGTPRDQIQIYRFLEPTLDPDTSPTTNVISNFEVLRFTYPDAPHDAETLLIDPLSHDLLILTKEETGVSTLFRAAGTTPADTPTPLEMVTSVTIGPAGEQGGQATAGDVSPSGDRFIIRSYTTVLLWPRAASLAATFATEAIELPSATEPQGEGLSFSAAGDAWFSTGEQALAIYESLASCP